MESSAAAAMMLAETAKALAKVPDPSQGNWLQKLGIAKTTYSLGSFGEQLQAFGSAMSAYGSSLGNFDSDKVTASTVAAQMLAETAKALAEVPDPDSSTWLDNIKLFNKGTSLEGFGGQIVSFGESMAAYGAHVAGLDSGKVENSVNAGKMLVGLYHELNKDKGFWDWVLGTVTLSEFGDDLTHFGNSLVSFDASAKSLDGNFTNVTTFFEELVKLSNMIYDAHLDVIHVDSMVYGLAIAFEEIIATMSYYVDEVGATDGQMGISFSTMMSNMGTVITNNADQIQSAYNDIMDGLDGPEGSKKSTAIANAIASAFAQGLGDGVESEKISY